MAMIVPFMPISYFSYLIAIVLAIRSIRSFFSGKKTLLTGPQASGKTTFLQYIAKENIPSGPSGAPRSYEVKDALFDIVTDFSGADAWLNGRFDKYIQEHDYILFFFDVSEFLKCYEYRLNTSARIDKIFELASPKKVLLVATHIDKVKVNYEFEVEQYFSGKPYQDFIKRIVYIDTTNKKCVKIILEQLRR